MREEFEQHRDHLAAQGVLPGAFKRGFNGCLDYLFPKYEKAIKLLTEIADEDYRGNRSHASVEAHKLLVELKLRK